MMPMHEASREHRLIHRYFSNCGARRDDVRLGVGDDGAIVQVPPEQDLVTVVDTLVADVHFASGTPAGAVGHKALAVNLSDVAAMGAQPAWATLALTLPDIDEAWIEAFARGFDALARSYDVALVGGDISRGPLAVTVQVQALLPRGRGLRRSGAGAGDGLYVTGTPGDAALGLAIEQGAVEAQGDARDYLLQRLRWPEPRVSTGQRLLDYASAAIDISDGLLTDLEHLCQASGVGARVLLEQLPQSAAYAEVAGSQQGLALGGGDDYELLVAIPAQYEAQIAGILEKLDCPLSRIGCLVAEAGIECVDGAGNPVSVPLTGYRHFAEDAE